jgi:hypothetical protein
MNYPNEEEELKLRFYRKLLDDLLNDNIKPFPTYLMEMEDPDFLELIRPFVMFGNMKPYNSGVLLTELPTREELETKKIRSYGNLYVLVNPN